MPDLLTHVLVGYSLGTVLTWYTDRLSDHHVPVLMLGSILPDLSKIRLLLPGGSISSLVGVPYSWLALHRVGAVLVLAGIASLLLRREERRVGLYLLSLGGCLHLLMDSGIKRANGLAPPYLYPFTWWQPPAGGLYVSSDLWPVAVAGAITIAVWVRNRQLGTE